MPLIDEDIKRITGLGFEKDVFLTKIGSVFRLKNKSGRCIFLRDDGCAIYEHRPEGCRHYPLVYNTYKKHFEMDHLCPFNFEFKVSKKDLESARNFIKTLELEEKSRTNNIGKHSKEIF